MGMQTHNHPIMGSQSSLSNDDRGGSRARARYKRERRPGRDGALLSYFLAGFFFLLNCLAQTIEWPSFFLLDGSTDRKSVV